MKRQKAKQKAVVAIRRIIKAAKELAEAEQAYLKPERENRNKQQVEAVK